MPLICPLCKADNASGPTCRRCKADLALLFALEDQRAAALARAREFLEQGGLEQAKRCAREAHEIRRGGDSIRWLAGAALLAGEFGEAWQLYQSE